MKSIRTKFAIILGLIVFIVCAGLGVVSYVTAENAITVVAEEMMVQMVSKSSQMIEGKLNYQFGILNTLANTEFIRDTNITTEEKLEYLKEVAVREGYSSFGVGDTQGKVMIIGGVELDLSERPYYQAVLQGNVMVTDPIASKADGKLVVNYAVPIKDKSENIIGVLIGSRNGDELSGLTNTIQIGETGKAYMLNSVGVSVAHYDQEKVISQENIIEAAKANPSLKTLGEISQHIIQGETGFGSYKYNGVERLVAYTPVENTGWFLGITVEKHEILSTLDSLKRGIIITSIIFLLVGLVTVYFITTFIVKKVKSLTVQLNVLSNGDFSIKQEIQSKKNKDEIGDAHHSLHIMQESISNMIKNIQGTAEVISENTSNLKTVSQQMASASENIAFSVQETSKGTASQATGLSNMNQIIYGFGERIDNIVISIEDIDSNTREINHMSIAGNDNMKRLIDSNNIVSDAFSDFSAKISGLNDNISRITDITNVINGIAEQTNLLSLNAAIEAVRAGEFGKGFAVVASEIGKLAEQSQHSSQNIDSLINNISEDANLIINTTGDLSTELEQQVVMIKSAIESYRSIVAAIGDIGEKIQTVNVSAGEINREKIQILDLVSDASSVSEEVAASSEEISAATQQLNASTSEVADSADKLSVLTKNMQEQVSRFKV